MTRKQLLKTDEVAEVAVEAGHWFEEHWRMVAAAAAAVAVIVAAVFGWIWFADQNREKARVMVDEGLAKYAEAEAVGFSDPATLEQALASFESAASKSGSAAPGDVARLYQGLALYRLGRTEEAIGQLEPWAARLDEAPTHAPHRGTRVLPVRLQGEGGKELCPEALLLRREQPPAIALGDDRARSVCHPRETLLHRPAPR